MTTRILPQEITQTRSPQIDAVGTTSWVVTPSGPRLPRGQRLRQLSRRSSQLHLHAAVGGPAPTPAGGGVYRRPQPRPGTLAPPPHRARDRLRLRGPAGLAERGEGRGPGLLRIVRGGRLGNRPRRRPAGVGEGRPHRRGPLTSCACTSAWTGPQPPQRKRWRRDGTSRGCRARRPGTAHRPRREPAAPGRRGCLRPAGGPRGAGPCSAMGGNSSAWARRPARRARPKPASTPS